MKIFVENYLDFGGFSCERDLWILENLNGTNSSVHSKGECSKIRGGDINQKDGEARLKNTCSKRIIFSRNLHPRESFARCFNGGSTFLIRGSGASNLFRPSHGTGRKLWRISILETRRSGEIKRQVKGREWDSRTHGAIRSGENEILFERGSGQMQDR